MPDKMFRFIYKFRLILLLLFTVNCTEKTLIESDVRSSQEMKEANGELFTPETQSFLRGQHWLETVKSIKIIKQKNKLYRIKLISDDKLFDVTMINFPIKNLFPQIYYQTNTFDEFDAFNLMLAEFSRNGLNVPAGTKKDEMACFVGSLAQETPWTLDTDYHFTANKNFKPLRISLINNCLKPGLWELKAIDNAGEIYHSWLKVNEAWYLKEVAKLNQISLSDIKKLNWQTSPVLLKLDKLRTIQDSFPAENIVSLDSKLGYSTQDSRKKLQKKFYKTSGKPPNSLYDLQIPNLQLIQFSEPGIYLMNQYKKYDFSFFRNKAKSFVRLVKPKTSYLWQKKRIIQFALKNKEYLEIEIDFGNRIIIIGNIPLPLLVRQEDFKIHGFGVGIFESESFSERRKKLIDHGYAPIYAYFAKKKNGEIYGLNNHAEGLEQMFIRAYPNAKKPYWEITLSSYERILDVAKFKIFIPKKLQKKSQEYSENYITPDYLNYRDDNLK